MLTLKCVSMCLLAKSKRGASCGGPCLSLIPALGRQEARENLCQFKGSLVYLLSLDLLSEITLSQKKKKVKSGIDKQKDFAVLLCKLSQVCYYGQIGGCLLDVYKLS